MAVGAIRVVTTKNVVHAALCLMLVLAGVAANYILLAAEFVAVVQVLVYIGAIVVLFLFGIMLTRAPIGRESGLDNSSASLSLVVGLLIFGLLASVLGKQFGRVHLHTARRAAHRRRGPLDLHPVRDPVRGGLGRPARRPGRRHRDREEGLTVLLNEFLFLAAFLFATGVYGVLARRNGVLVLMCVELILNAVNINLVAFGAFRNSPVGQVFALFVIASRRRRGRRRPGHRAADLPQPQVIDLDEVDVMKG